MADLPKCNVCQCRLFKEQSACVVINASISPGIAKDTGELQDLSDPAITIDARVQICMSCFSTNTGPALGLPETVISVMSGRQS